MENPSKSITYGTIWDHTVLLGTWHRRKRPTLILATQTSIQFTHRRWVTGWVALDDWLHTEIVHHPRTVTYPGTNCALHKATTLIRHVLTTRPCHHNTGHSMESQRRNNSHKKCKETKQSLNIVCRKCNMPPLPSSLFLHQHLPTEK